MRVWFSGDVELVTTVENAGSAIGRALPYLYFLSRIDRLPAERDVAGSGALLGWRRRRPPNHLLDRSREHVEIRTQRLELVRMVGQRQQPTRDRVARRLRTRTEQQTEEQIQLEVRQGRRVGIIESRVGDHRQHVISRLSTLRCDQLLPVGVHPRPGL